MNRSEIYSFAADLIAPKGAWSRDTPAKRVVPEGSQLSPSCMPMSPDAISWSVGGAIGRAKEAGATQDQCNDAFEHFRSTVCGGRSIYLWNQEQTQATAVSALRGAAA